MTCTLSFHYITSLGDSGDVSFDVPDGSYTSAYVYWYTGSPLRYEARSDGDIGTVALTPTFTPPDGFTVTYSKFSNSCPLPTYTYDCINGTCVKSTVHGTTGLYPSLSECEISCGSRGCSGQCVSSADWAKIEGLIDQLKHRSCG